MNVGAINNPDVFESKPWLADESKYLRITERQNIATTMQYIKDNHVSLTVVLENGNILMQSVVINIDGGSVALDKPLNWVDRFEVFRVYFRDCYQRWTYFLVSEPKVTPFAIFMPMPDELCSFQKRICKRVIFPPGTRALVKKENESMATVFVHDLSSAGMLICNDPADGEYDQDSIINDIVVSIPVPSDNQGGIVARKVLPLISRGQVVRSFMDGETSRLCYGIAFQYDSSYVRETISQLIADVDGFA